MPWPGAAVLGAGLAMSSTAIVLPMLAEAELLQSRAGRDGFAVLLFQDLAFIPLVAVVPLLAEQTLPDHVPWHDVARAAVAVAVILVGGRFAIPPLIRAIGGARTPEMFTTASLLIVAGTAYIANLAGLSMSLGAFMAGVLLSESEYRHELQADIAPFEGLLLGFFFISVGMSADLGLACAHPAAAGRRRRGACCWRRWWSASRWRCCRGRACRTRSASAWRCRRPASSASCCSAPRSPSARWRPDSAAMATLVAAVSMAATPVLFALSERFVIPRLEAEPVPDFDTIEAADAPVIICGFGRFGQIIARVLRMHGIRFTALERDPGQVDVRAPVRHQGVFRRSDAARPAARGGGGAGQAADRRAGPHGGRAARRRSRASGTFPQLKIMARARNRRHALSADGPRRGRAGARHVLLQPEDGRGCR